MSVLEVFEVWYLDSGQEKCQSFNWFDFDGLRNFVANHEPIEIKFKAEGLEDSSRPKVSNKKVYIETLPKEEVGNLSEAWIDSRRKQY